MVNVVLFDSFQDAGAFADTVNQRLGKPGAVDYQPTSDGRFFVPRVDGCDDLYAGKPVFTVGGNSGREVL